MIDALAPLIELASALNTSRRTNVNQTQLAKDQSTEPFATMGDAVGAKLHELEEAVENPSDPERERGSRAEAKAEALPSAAKGRVAQWFEKRSKSWGKDRLERLVSRRGKVAQSMRNIPENVHRTGRQSELVLELVDDFRSGTYRAIPWHSVAVLVGVLLYTVNPADVVPDVIPLVGGLDDVTLIALAIRLARKDLIKYCEFKGYDTDKYFGGGAPA
jgi:uncharacterized membrane protein YkvA (DUF1232 family)